MATTPDPGELAVHLLVVSARFTRLAARETPSAIPRALWRALAQLEELGPTRVSDLAAADRVSQPTATTLVQKLVERGWAERCTDPRDARAVRVTITDGGARCSPRAGSPPPRRSPRGCAGSIPRCCGPSRRASRRCVSCWRPTNPSKPRRTP